MRVKNSDTHDSTMRPNWKARVAAMWYMWQLYARLSERIGFHWRDISGSPGLPEARMGYDLFWPAVVLFPFVPLKSSIFSGTNILVFAYVALFMISGTFALFSHVDKTKKECENLKEKGYWYPEFMVKSPARAMVFILVENVVYIVVIFLFGYFVIYKP